MSSQVSSPVKSRVLAIMIAGGLSLAGSRAGLRAAEPATMPAYPRDNQCTCYEVDPHWPQRPAGMAWGAMPGVAVNDHDEVWIFTRAKPPVQAYDRSGKFLRSWGSEIVGNAHFIRFDREGNVWLADVGRHVVRKFTPEGKVLRTLGTPDQPGEDQSHLNKPTDMAVTPEGEVFVSDGYGNNRVVHFDREGKFVKSWGKLGTAAGEFSLPHSIARDSQGRLYVADRNNARIQVFDQAGKPLDQWRGVIVPWNVTITPRDEIWVCGSSPMPWRPEDKLLSCPPKDQVVMRFDSSGKIQQLWTIPKGEDGKERPGDVNWLHGVAVDSHGDLYVGDIIGKRAQKLSRQK